MAQPLLITLVSGSALTDLCRGKIYNIWLALGFVFGLIYVLVSEPGSLKERLIAMVMVMAVLLPAYLFRGMGAGDVKLLAVIAFFLGVEEAFICLVLSFILGLTFSFPKCVKEGNLKQQIHFAVPVLASVLIVLTRAAVK